MYLIIHNITTTKIGPTYGDLSTDSTLPHSSIPANNQSSNGNSKLPTLIRLSNNFYKNFLYPKENGRYLALHLEKDLLFFALNNFIVLFGLLFSSIYLFKSNKRLFVMVILLFFTSFILWGNMDVYGGGGVDLSNLRNSHTRYLLPITTLFYILGFFYLPKVIKDKYVFLLLLMFIFIRCFISLRDDYPFLNYSLINKNGYVYDYSIEKQSIAKLSIPKDALIASAAFDDYDLSYYFKNYADLKLLSGDQREMRAVLKRFVDLKTRKVYLLFPKNDSRFNPISQKDLEKLYSFIELNYSIKIIFEDHYKKLLLISAA